MNIKNCEDCGEYKYIESEGKCRDCCVDKYDLKVDDKVTEVELTDKKYYEIYSELKLCPIVSHRRMNYVSKEIEFETLTEYDQKHISRVDSVDCSTESLIEDIEDVIGKELDFSDI